MGYDVAFLSSMPSLASVRALNNAFSPSYLPVAVFVGGNSGVGQGLVESYARSTKGNAQIYIVGRNKAAAEALFAKLPSPTHPNARKEFIACDLTLIRNVQVLTRDMLSRIPKINFLFLTPGILSNNGRDETEEGLDKKMVLYYYTRFKIIRDLLPALEKANQDGEEAKVLTVLRAALGTRIALDDLGLKKGYSPNQAMVQSAAYTDAVIEEFGQRYPQLTFVHAHPGNTQHSFGSTVDSNWMKLLAPVFRVVVNPLFTPTDQAAEYLLSGVFRAESGSWKIGSQGQDLGKGIYSEDVRKKVWDHSVEATSL